MSRLRALPSKQDPQLSEHLREVCLLNLSPLSTRREMKDLQPKGDPRGASTSREGHAGTESSGFRRIAKASVENQSPTWGLAVVGLATL